MADGAAVYLAAFIPVWGLAVNAAATVVLSRAARTRSLLRALYAGCAWGLVAVVVLRVAFGSATGDRLGDAVADALIYGSLSYGYFHFINLGETSRRVRVMRELLDAGAGLTEAELLRRYNAADIRAARVGRLLRSGQVVEKEGGYHIGRPLLLYGARLVVFLKLFLLGRPHTDVGRPDASETGTPS